ncbi:uncharacterized protein PAC_04262 [Phialocephala subalpina]|uniref:MJ1316 RNA cyclic group end recognition domain-containing protein n=1 Tax=Phialocephala subalpina TaxID=576137 RepID=A0A1L7WNN4_9HELO|nr:uncharacterized protein PAC_04262 [Phialocephala subalpina]
MAEPLFTFAALDGTSTDFTKLRNDLELEYGMPIAEDWQRFERKFQLLRMYFEQGKGTIDETDIKIETPSNDASKARASALPRVRIFKAGTFSMKVLACDEPLVCKAIGTISPERYEDVFWEKVAEVEDREKIEVDVFTINATSSEVTIFMRFDGCEIKLRYLQWGSLIRAYPSILDAPQSFLEHGSESARTFVESMKRDAETARLINENARFAYFYIRAWAIQRGIWSKIEESDIVKLLAQGSQPYQDDQNQMCLISKLILKFFDHFSSTYQSPSSGGTLSGILGDHPYAEDTAKDWAELLEKLRTQAIQSKLGYCPIYIRIDVLSLGSDVHGGEWIRKVELEVKILQRNIQTQWKTILTVLPWPYRLVADGSQDGDTYECHYIFGLSSNVPQDVAQSMLAIDSTTQIWREKVQKSRQPGTDLFHSVSVILFPAADLAEQVGKPALPETPYIRCTKPFPLPTLKAPERQGAPAPSTGNSWRKVPKGPGHALRPASDVLSRLRFDPKNYKIDRWVIGYEDRHKEFLQEKPAGQWVGDESDEAWIPMHRIWYFRLVGGEVMWDRSTGEDRIFRQKGGSKDVPVEVEGENLSKRERQQMAKGKREGAWEQREKSPEKKDNERSKGKKGKDGK